MAKVTVGGVLIRGNHGEGSHHIYLVTKWTGDPRNLTKDEHSELAWVKIDEVDRLDLAVRAGAAVFRSLRDLTQNTCNNS